MRADANRIALRAVRAILDGAAGCTLTVNRQDVVCTLARRVPEPWPKELTDLSPEADGPWPSTVEFACEWDGGKCTIALAADLGSGRRYADEVSLRASTSYQKLVWMNFRRAIGDTPDGSTTSPEAWVILTKQDGADVVARMARAMRALVAEANLPLGRASRMLPCEIEVPAGALTPPGDVAARRILHLALIKLDFMSRGERAKTRGRALVNVQKLVGAVPESVEDDESDEDLRPRHYWAGGLSWSDTSRLQEFISGRFWQLGYPADAKEPTGKQSWRRFREIAIGDWFAIKGYGDNNDLVVHLVGEVTEIDATTGRLSLRKLDVPLYSGKAPRGAGGKSFDTLVPIVRSDAIAALFGKQAETERPQHVLPDIPLNLILYGPPGTGKTYSLQQNFLPIFTRTAGEARDIDAASEVVADMPWLTVITVALHQLGGRAKVDQLVEHELVRAKYAFSAPKSSSVREILWGYLGQHTVESSTTVNMKRRLGDLLFDKEKDGTWKIAAPLPEDIADVAATLGQPKVPAPTRDFVFTTFHQSYSYEDFVEGIKPRVAREGDEAAALLYELQDGVFNRAARAALRLTGFTGTLDEFCHLPKSERTSYFEGAPRYALFIDEINRGNVSRVFGELITLLEEDKRLGAENEIIVTLPYSRTLFGVPANLHLIGTMNTADRSVDALDTALRRRFAFRELPPQPELLSSFPMEGSIDLAAMLHTINRRLEKLRDRDHCIGHAYFLPLEDNATLALLTDIMSRAILPLLQEYFFGDWGKIGLVLGPEFVRARDLRSTDLADFPHDDRETLNERVTYELVDLKSLTSLSYRRIYERIDT